MKVELNPDMFYGDDSDMKQEADHYEPSADYEEAKTNVKLEGMESNASKTPEDLPLKGKDKGTKSSKLNPQDKPFKCTQCEKSFIRRAKLIIHERVHTGEKPFNCSHCTKKFATRGALKIHEIKHTGKYPYVCAYCNKNILTKQNLEIHLKKFHGVDPDSNIVEAMKQDIGIKQEGVAVDADGVPLPLPLNLPLLDPSLKPPTIRSGKLKPYGCTTCGKKFNRKAKLADHQRVHTGEKPFTCS